METLRSLGLVFTVALMAQAAVGCSSSDIERFFHAGGKIAYDSFKGTSKNTPAIFDLLESR